MRGIAHGTCELCGKNRATIMMRGRNVCLSCYTQMWNTINFRKEFKENILVSWPEMADRVIDEFERKRVLTFEKITQYPKSFYSCDYCEKVLGTRTCAVCISKEKFKHFGGMTFIIRRSIYLCKNCHNLFAALGRIKPEEKKMETTSRVIVKDSPPKPKFGISDKVSRRGTGKLVLLCTSNIYGDGRFNGVVIHNVDGGSVIGRPYNHSLASCYELYPHSILLESK